MGLGVKIELNCLLGVKPWEQLMKVDLINSANPLTGSRNVARYLPENPHGVGSRPAWGTHFVEQSGILLSSPASTGTTVPATSRLDVVDRYHILE